MSNGGYAAPLGLEMIPAAGGIDALAAAQMYQFNVTNFNDPNSGSYYNIKIEDVKPGTTFTTRWVILEYRDLGIATITLTLTGVIGAYNADSDEAIVSNSQTIPIGTNSATGRLMMWRVGFALSAAMQQLTITRAPNGGPVSIVRVKISGTVEAE